MRRRYRVAVYIRKMDNTDIPYVQSMMQELYDIHAEMLPTVFKKGVRRKKEYFEKIIEAGDRTILIAVSTEGNQRIGFIKGKVVNFKETDYLKSRIYGFVDGIFVEKAFRGKLIEYKLQKSLFDWFKEKKIFYVEASVWDTNEKAKDYYKLFGYKYSKHGLYINL